MVYTLQCVSDGVSDGVSESSEEVVPKARSSLPPRRYEALAPASPTSPLCTRSSGAAGRWLLDGTEAVARKAEYAH
jgi:hypothetical protein